MVDTNDRWLVSAEPSNEPFGDPAPRPVFARTWRWQYLDRHRHAVGRIDAQALQARGRSLRTGVVDPNVTVKGRDEI